MAGPPAGAPTRADRSTRLLISCPDGPGIVAAISGFLFERGANIVSSHQYSTHPEHGTFFMRCAFYVGREGPGREQLEADFAALAERFAMKWRFSHPGERMRVAIMVSRADHCLLDLLWRARRGELQMEVPFVISNHDDLRAGVESFGIRFEHIPVTRETKPEAEREALALMRGTVDTVVLARYMQILSGAFLEQLGCPVINIHHSFLPAFAGAEPYRKAYERGVKLIGATAHYVTEQLDEGPIIEQDVIRVGHEDTIADLERVGRDVERMVLARAVRTHLDGRVLLDGARTVVF